MLLVSSLILIGVAMIDTCLLRIMKAQRAHYEKVETLLSELRR